MVFLPNMNNSIILNDNRMKRQILLVFALFSAYLMSQVDRSSLPEWKKEWNKFNSMSGRYEPSALLPCQLPADMKTVEEQCEDLPFDIECYVDSEGNTYDFAFGMNWSGVIKDKRVKRWKR